MPDDHVLGLSLELRQIGEVHIASWDLMKVVRDYTGSLGYKIRTSSREGYFILIVEEEPSDSFND